MKFRISILFYSILIIGLSSCERDLKHDVDEENDIFFLDKYITDNNPHVIPIVEARSLSDEQKKFKKDIKRYLQKNLDIKNEIEVKLGQVMWDRLTYFDLDGYMLGIYPVAKVKSSMTEGILIATLSEGNEIVKIRYDKRKAFEHLPEKSEIVSGELVAVDKFAILTHFLVFDKDVFGYYDCELINNYKDIVQQESRKPTVTPRGCWVEYDVTSTTHYYTCVSYASGGDEYCGYDYSVSEYEFVEYCNDGGGSSGNNSESDSGGGGNRSGSGEGDDEDEIDCQNFEGNLCEFQDIYCVYEKMQGNSLFRKLSNEFVGESRVDLVWNVQPNVSCNGKANRIACTTLESGSTNTLIINLSSNVLDNNVMLIAHSMIHESVHAEIKRLLIEESVYGADDINDSNGIWDKYINYRYQGSPSEAEHEYMIYWYTRVMGDALNEFATQNLHEENIAPLSWYRYFAYTGLRNTESYAQLSQYKKDWINYASGQIVHTKAEKKCD